MERKPEINNNLWPSRVLIAQPHGFCAGVVRAVDCLREVQRRNHTERVYSYHQIIHNAHVVKEFEESGVVFVDDTEEVPNNSVVVFSAHGVSSEIEGRAKTKGLKVVDATCPLVEKSHREVSRFYGSGYTILHVCKKNHDEAVGTLGRIPKDSVRVIETVEDALTVQVPDLEKVAMTTQTTLSLDDTAKIRAVLKNRFPNLAEPKRSDICYATQNRQDGVKEMVIQGAKVIVVIGSQNSSNSKRLKEVAESLGSKAVLVDDISELDTSMFLGVRCVGLTSGASAPEDKFQELIDLFRQNGSCEFVDIIAADESKIVFAPPKGLN